MKLSILCFGLALLLLNPYIYAQTNNASAEGKSDTIYYEVVFGVYGDAGGIVTAEVDGVAITSGDNIIEGATIVFTAIPDQGAMLCDWIYNGEFTGITGLVVEETSLSQNIEVLAEFYGPCPHGISELQGEKTRIYPNPSNGILNIAIEKPANVNIYNINGACVYAAENVEQTIKIEDLAPGIYLVKLESNMGIIVKKIIVK